MESNTYRTLIGISIVVTDELLVEAFYATPTMELAETMAGMLNARGYSMTAQLVIDEMYL